MTNNGIPKPEAPIMRKSSMQQAGENERGRTRSEPAVEDISESAGDAPVGPTKLTAPRPKAQPQKKAPVADTASKRLSNSRDVLLSDVWGYRYTGGTRTVDVHVRRLREKLPVLVDALVTVKQFGYKLVEES